MYEQDINEYISINSTDINIEPEVGEYEYVEVADCESINGSLNFLREEIIKLQQQTDELKSLTEGLKEEINTLHFNYKL